MCGGRENDPSMITVEEDQFAAVRHAAFYGFDCANCGAHKVMTPVRRNPNGPFFCTFFCAWDFAGKSGNTRAQEIADKLRGKVSMTQDQKT